MNTDNGQLVDCLFRFCIFFPMVSINSIAHCRQKVNCLAAGSCCSTVCFLCHSKTLQLELVGIENATLCILLIQNTEVYRDKLNMKKMGGKKSLPRLSGSLSTVLQGGAKQHLFVLFGAKGNLKGREKSLCKHEPACQSVSWLGTGSAGHRQQESL